MNIINFHKYKNNTPFINEKKIYYSDNYSKNGYYIILVGNGYNKYIFTLKYKNQLYKILFQEKHIIEWTIYSYNEDYISFSGVGKDINTDMYYRFSSTDCDNFEYLNDKFQIIDISISNDRPDKRLIEIGYEDQLCELYDSNEIDKIIDFPLDKSNKIRYECNELCKNKMFYFIIDDNKNKILPFEVVEFHDEYISAYIYYNWNKIYIDSIYIYNVPEIGDEFNVEISLEMNDVEIFEYCYILG